LSSSELRCLIDQTVPTDFPRDPHSLRAIIGHARLTTNGYQGIRYNNQPVHSSGVVGVHNGIIVNVAALWRDHPELSRHTDVDTEVFMALLGQRLGQGETLPEALSAVYAEIEGSASVALLFEAIEQLVLATNTGSLYVCRALDGLACIFASEEAFLASLMKSKPLAAAVGEHQIRQVPVGTAVAIDLKSLDMREFPLSQGQPARGPEILSGAQSVKVFDSILAEDEARGNIRRCTRCILPETMPHIDFDEQGVCNFCRFHKPIEYRGVEAMRQAMSAFGTGGRADCIVAFSGGRDSCYSLHYLTKELGLKCIAYTYDWGMVNDLARRNQARVIGKLGVDQVIISADIKRKRRNIRLNVEAWLRKPDLGLVPLFMAGDKHFFYYANLLKKETGIHNSVWAENQLERTNFKVGFCNISSGNKKERIYKISSMDRAKLVFYYGINFIKNPSYINVSLFDTVTSYISYYVINHDYLWFYDFIPWDEETINNMLLGEYDWELNPGFSSTWRIGDGTAPFYNFIYHTVAGFTEFDTFRSNQIRQGVLTRERALELVAQENVPNYQGIMEYCQLIGVDFDYALSVINSMPKRYITCPEYSRHQ
jgi:hypothetical protein